MKHRGIIIYKQKFVTEVLKSVEIHGGIAVQY
jgi:hypothetical protein